MASSRKQLSALRGSHTLRSRTNKHTDARTKLRYELLEPRHLLAGDLLLDNASTSQPTSQANAPITWFERFDNVSRVALESLATVDRPLAADVAGPQAPSIGEWIIQLAEDATADVRRVANVDSLLNDNTNHFTIISGLGTPGTLLVRGEGPTKASIESSLQLNTNVEAFSLNQRMQGQATFPSDPNFSGMTGLNNVGQFGATNDADIDAPEAWDLITGSTEVVVGVVDSGVDVTHPDLYLNIWINQGEIDQDLHQRLVNTDGDRLITFYDLNAPANSTLVHDFNGNGYIDAIDLLQDPAWADGRDTDGNGFIDDFFGWNFRSGSTETFAPNNPSDILGHGTHVAGTIGAIGNNTRGVTGINWRSSLMALKFLDENNQGDMASAIAAVNYATMMRTQYDTNIRVLNNSWGQPGSPNIALQNAVQTSGEAGILFVAAAGNGNILGQGVDNDRTPFYPASYELENVIAVGASDGSDRLAGFSNYARHSVDVAAPGVGILSTLPGGRYGEANGTSMATPHVSGTAALIWTLQPDATVAEIRRAILEQGDAIPSLGNQISSGRRLNAQKSLLADVFAPNVELASANDVTTAGGTEHLITVQYKNRLGVDITSLGDNDLIVTREAAIDQTVTTSLVSATENADKTEVTAIYRLAAIGGTWDAEDYGNYIITARADAARSLSGLGTLEMDLGSFQIKIAAPGIFYVDSFADSVDVTQGDGQARDIAGRTTLRAAIQEANALAPAPVKIFLQAGTYSLTIAPVVDAGIHYPTPTEATGYNAPTSLQWSNASTGDLDLLGKVTLVGLGVNRTMIDAAGIDRVINVYPGATVSLTGLTLTGGNAPVDHSGGAILTSGDLSLDLVKIKNNSATGGPSSLGGAIAQWDGTLKLFRSTLESNTATAGGGVFVTNNASARIDSSTLVENTADGQSYDQKYQFGGGGILASQSGKVDIINSTLAQNESTGVGIGDAVHNVEPVADGYHSEGYVSGNGRYVVFYSSTLVTPNDFDFISDVYLYDRQTDEYELISVSTEGIKGNGTSSLLLAHNVSDDGRFVVFSSLATNLVENDTNGRTDVFLRDRLYKTTTRINVSALGVEGNEYGTLASISNDGKIVVFESTADNLVPGDTNGKADLFLYNIEAQTLKRINPVL